MKVGALVEALSLYPPDLPIVLEVVDGEDVMPNVHRAMGVFVIVFDGRDLMLSGNASPDHGPHVVTRTLDGTTAWCGGRGSCAACDRWGTA